MKLNYGVYISDLAKYRRSLEKRLEAPVYPEKYAALNYRDKLIELNRRLKEDK